MSKKTGEKKSNDSPFEEDNHIPFWISFTTYLGYGVLIGMGYLREMYRQFFPAKSRATRKGYAPLLRDFDDFYTRRLYTRIRDCWNRPINTRPGARFGVMERVSDDYNISFKLTGNTIPCVNLSSYNYLGFAENPPFVLDAVKESIRRYGVGAASASAESGMTSPLQKLEKLTAEFCGKEDAVVIGMGFATNSTTLPVIAGKGCLLISDCLNHASLVAGARGSEAKIKVFKHNNFQQLEAVIKKAIWQGQPRTHKPWNKIMIVVEGIYSMEGEILNLKKIVEIKNKYNCLLYVDEAHSIGAIGATGRGVCEYMNVPSSEVDLLMGTYTKSFGSIGGYIAGDRDVIRMLRENTGGAVCASSLPAGCAQQALSALEVVMGRDGTDHGKKALASIASNARFFRKGLVDLGLTVYGDDASPVIPALLYNPAKMPAFSRECIKRGLAVVVVGYPATPLIESRVRFCISAGHNMEDLTAALEIIKEVRDLVMIKYSPENEKKV
eukprot:TRINITY_DN436_c10_g1_i1.p1 TRINITY_DN436_c10_g1~~TRINITY_DN436_c10_g1_i1.p1  ORF type:complete len:519 (+),score=98.57 TRINITY_DN436_c10_g1_i1:68-1558(+)